MKRSGGAVKESEEGVKVQTLVPGDGATYPKDGQIVAVHYVGYVGCLESGNKFDSSRDRGKPFKFKVMSDEVIKGWNYGIKKMSKGEKAMLTLSPEYGYGERGYPGVIPRSSVLKFEIELLEIS